MAKNTLKIAISITLVGVFTIFSFVAVTYDQLKPSAYLVLGLLFIFLFFFGIALGQRFTSPLKKILNDAQEIANGNLSSRVYLERSDELGELAQQFNKIAEELQDAKDGQANAEKTIGIKVKARTQELEETINALEQKVKNRTIELERLVKEVNELKSSGTIQSAGIIPPKKI